MSVACPASPTSTAANRTHQQDLVLLITRRPTARSPVAAATSNGHKPAEDFPSVHGRRTRLPAASTLPGRLRMPGPAKRRLATGRCDPAARRRTPTGLWRGNPGRRRPTRGPRLSCRSAGLVPGPPVREWRTVNGSAQLRCPGPPLWRPRLEAAILNQVLKKMEPPADTFSAVRHETQLRSQTETGTGAGEGKWFPQTLTVPTPRPGNRPPGCPTACLRGCRTED